MVCIMDGMVDVSVSIVHRNEEDTLRACLQSLQKDLEKMTYSWEIVVADNGSDEDISGWMKEEFPHVRVIINGDNIGFGAGHNAILKTINAKYVFILNPDTEFTHKESVVGALIDFMEERPYVGMCGPKIHYPDGELQYSCYRFPTFLQPIYSRTSLGKKGKGKQIADAFQMKDFDHETIRPVDWIMGSAMLVRMDMLDDVGYFDERYWMYAEDSDLCRRLWEAYHPVYYVPSVHIVHLHGRASAKVPGVIQALVKNKYAREHLKSWLKYFFKWRNNHNYYVDESSV